MTQPHPNGRLLSISTRASLWSERLGVEVVEGSLAWLDEQAKEVRWLRDDLRYHRTVVVSAEASQSSGPSTSTARSSGPIASRFAEA
jgi:hypothetical protein